MRLSKKAPVHADMSSDSAFNMLDVDGSGTITADELRVAITRGGSALSVSEVERVIKEVDENGDGMLQRGEFARVWRHFTTTAKESADATKSLGRSLFASLFNKRATPVHRAMSAREAFSIFDANGDGFITVGELKEVLMMGTGRVLADEEVEAIVGEVDVDGNGMLDLAQFEAMWKLFAAGSGAGASVGAAGGSSGRGTSASTAGASATSTSATALRRGGAKAPFVSSEHGTERRPGSERGGSNHRGAAKASAAAASSVLRAAGVAANVAEAAEAEAAEAENEGEWSPRKWLSALGVAKVICSALQVPPAHVMPPFEYVRKLTRPDIERLLGAAMLGGLSETLIEGIEALSKQQVASSAALNDKFQARARALDGWAWRCDTWLGCMLRLWLYVAAVAARVCVRSCGCDASAIMRVCACVSTSSRAMHTRPPTIRWLRGTRGRASARPVASNEADIDAQAARPPVWRAGKRQVPDVVWFALALLWRSRVAPWATSDASGHGARRLRGDAAQGDGE